jgi:hypothetical protein
VAGIPSLPGHSPKGPHRRRRDPVVQSVQVTVKEACVQHRTIVEPSVRVGYDDRHDCNGKRQGFVPCLGTHPKTHMAAAETPSSSRSKSRWKASRSSSPCHKPRASQSHTHPGSGKRRSWSRSRILMIHPHDAHLISDIQCFLSTHHGSGGRCREGGEAEELVPIYTGPYARQRALW